jgi:hypothetical protein
MDKIPNCTNVIVQLLGESQCSPNEPPNTLPKGVVHPFNMGCLTTLFANRSMALGG